MFYCTQNAKTYTLGCQEFVICLETQVWSNFLYSRFKPSSFFFSKIFHIGSRAHTHPPIQWIPWFSPENKMAEASK